jgi:RNA polymerase sigma factor (TIGR02999 family)
MSENSGDLTQLLVDWSSGDSAAFARLMPAVYDELHRLAERYLRRERGDHTLQTTALVHEAYIRLIDQNRVEWQNSLQFFGLAAQMMRRILVDHARRHQYAKRGGNAPRISLDDAPEVSSERAADVVAIDEALSSLAEVDADLARIVELRYFGGFKSSEIGELMGISVPTVTRKFSLAKAWLYRYLSNGGDGGAE